MPGVRIHSSKKVFHGGEANRRLEVCKGNAQMRQDPRPWWIIGAVGLVAVAACNSTPASSAHVSSAPTVRATPTGSETPGVVSTRSAWTELTPAAAPLARNSAGFAYDAATGTDLLTGGRTGCGPGAGQYVDTWSWNGTTWAQMHPAVDGPGAMAWFTMAYDDATRQEIAVGAYSGCGIATAMWSWNGSQWTPAPQNLALPDAMATYSLAYDAASRTMLLFGVALDAQSGQPVVPGHQGAETWSWDGTRWTFLHPATSPPALRDVAFAYDAATRDVVLFGGDVASVDNLAQYGAASSATWLWNGTTWAEATPAASPPARFGASMVYDPDLGTNVLFGGVTGDIGNQPPTGAAMVFDDMWSWSGSAWLQLHPATLPSGRFFGQMTYDSTNHELVLFGGSLNQNADANDTWVFRAS
jgi:hypothetical protein